MAIHDQILRKLNEGKKQESPAKKLAGALVTITEVAKELPLQAQIDLMSAAMDIDAVVAGLDEKHEGT